MPIFAALPDPVRAELVAGATRRRLAAGEWLLHEGEPASSLFLVVSGRLEILAGEPPEVIREVGRDAAVGELALLTGAPRSASVRARRDTELLEIPAARFVELVERDLAAMASVARELANQLRGSRGRTSPASSLPSTIAVLPRGPGADAPGFADRLTSELAGHGRVERLDASSAGPPEGWGARLDAAETPGRQVLLVAADGEGEWARFCRRQADRVIAVDSSPPDAAALARRLTGRSLGVVLSGGGARGLAHLGVIEVLLESGLRIDRVGGCSMGALVGAQLAAGRDPADMLAWARTELVERSPLGDYTVPRIALTRGRRGRAMLARTFGGARIEQLPREFFCVSADLVSARLVVHREGSLADALAASVALPGIVPPAGEGERLLVDGGVLDNLPVAEMAAAGEGPVIAVDVTARFAPPPPGARLGIKDVLLRTLTLGASDTADAARSHADLVIEPDVSGVGMLDFARLDDLVTRGRVAARRALETAPAELGR